jgi:hypothetical protein
MEQSPRLTAVVATVSEPEFVNLLRGSGIDSQLGGPVRHPYLMYWPARLHRLAKSIPGLLKRLQIRAQYTTEGKTHTICTTPHCRGHKITSSWAMLQTHGKNSRKPCRFICKFPSLSPHIRLQTCRNTFGTPTVY